MTVIGEVHHGLVDEVFVPTRRVFALQLVPYSRTAAVVNG